MSESARPLAGRVIAITGASSGIGRATALAVAAEGALVVLSARRADLLAALAAEITAAGGQALAVPGDVTRESDMEALVAAAVEYGGRLDVMIANAGIGFHDTFVETAPDVMRRLVDVNLMGTLYAAHAAMRRFQAQGAGHLIAVSSIVGRRGIGGSAVYSATKAAQIGLIEGLRAECRGTPIHASVVVPISTATGFRDAIRRDFGRDVRGTGPRQAPEAVARAIVACIHAPRPEVYPYRPAKALAVLAVVAPGLADWLVKRFSRSAVRRS